MHSIRGSTYVRRWLCLLGLFALAAPVAAQVSVSGAVVGNGGYGTLAAAFTAINGNAQVGATITIVIGGNTTETATARLNATQATAISIVPPAPGSARSITGNLDAPLVELDGADRVTIDGLTAGVSGLTFTNTHTGNNASALRLVNDASQNVFHRVTLRGSSASPASAVVVLAGGTVTGNDGNTISSSVIVAASANAPVNAVMSVGTATPGKENSGNKILTNLISSYFHATQPSAGILIGGGNESTELKDNRLYQTSTLIFTVANTHYGIRVASGSGHTLSGNIIGYQNSSGAGTYTISSTVATQFIAIGLDVGNLSATSVQNNSVGRISLTTGSSATTGAGALCGISVAGGLVNVGTTLGNTIGLAGSADVLLATTTTNPAAVVGIHVGGFDAVDLRNNTVAGLSSVGSGNGIGGAVFALRLEGFGPAIVRNNTFGGSVGDSLRAGVNGTTIASSVVAGIITSNQSMPSVEIRDNLVRNLASFGIGNSGYARGITTVASSTSPTNYQVIGNTISALQSSSSLSTMLSGQGAVVGLNIASGTNNVIRANTISNLVATNGSSAATVAAGISAANATNTTISGNRVLDIRNSSSSTSATAPGQAIGILLRSGTDTLTVANNMVALGSGGATNTAVIGIAANHGSVPDPSDVIVYNSIRIAGSGTVGSQPSFGFARTDFTGVAHNVSIDFRNNLVENVRSGGSGVHAAIANNYGAAVSDDGWPATASDFNVFNAPAASVGHWGTALDFSDWKAASGGDSHSYSGVPITFVDPGSDLHLAFGMTPTPIASGATEINGLSVDFDAQARPGPAGSVNGATLHPDIGADEFDGVLLDTLAPDVALGADITRRQGTSAQALLANVSDNGTASANITASVNGAPPAGITIGTPQNTAGAISALVAADCDAAVATVQFSLRVSDAASNFSDRNINVIVSDDTAPTLGIYPNAAANAGGTVEVTPDAAPTDDIGASIVATAPDFDGSFAVDPVSGIVTISNAGPVGSHAVTVTSTDACNQVATRAFLLVVQGTPSVTTDAPIQRAGDPVANQVLATVADAEDAEQTLSITINGGASATVNGVTVDALVVDAVGVVTGNVIASCLADDANFQLRVTDSAEAFSESNLSVDVPANMAPTLTYAPSAILIGTGGARSPATGPSDSGSILGIEVANTGSYTGGVSVDASGNVALTNAAPAGDHTLTIRATDNCLAETLAPLLLTVLPIDVFANSFE